MSVSEAVGIYWATRLGAALDEHDAPNHLEIVVGDGNGRTYHVIVAREGRSPARRLVAALDRLTEAGIDISDL